MDPESKEQALNDARRGSSKVGAMLAGAAWWGPALTTLANALIASGFALASLITPAAVVGGRSLGQASVIFAMYAAARSFPLLAAVVWNVVVRSRQRLGALAVVMALVQACDAVVGVVISEPSKVIGPAVLAVTTLACARVLLRPGRLNKRRDVDAN